MGVKAVRSNSPMLLQLFAEGGDAADGASDAQDTNTQETPSADGGGSITDQGDTGTGDVDTDDDDRRIYTKRQVSEIVSQRVNELKPYRDTIRRLAKTYGVSEKQMLDYMSQVLSLYERYGQSSGYNQQAVPQVGYRQMNQDPTQVALNEARAARRETELLAMRQNPVYGNLDEIKDELIEYADQKGLSLREAFWILHGERRAAELSAEAEQKVLAQVERRRGLGAETDDAAQEFQDLGLSHEDIQAARALGLDPKRAAKLLKVENLDDFEQIFGEDKS